MAATAIQAGPTGKCDRALPDLGPTGPFPTDIDRVAARVVRPPTVPPDLAAR